MKNTKIKNKIIYSIVALVFIFNVLFNFSFAHAEYSADTLVSMTNSARAQNGLGSLSTNSELATAAYNKANDMLTQGYFAHNSPDGKTPWDFIKGAGYDYVYAGENLAIGYTDATELFDAWMNSVTHRENILNPNYREIGLAVVSGNYQGSDTIVVVQEFGSPQEVASEQITPTPTPSVTISALANPQSYIVKEKSEFKPKNIFAGEEVTFVVTVSGEIQTLEVEAFDQSINLLNSAAISSTESGKTYTLSQKMEKEGVSDVKVLALDKSGNRDTLSLGKLTVNQAVIAKQTASQEKGWFNRFISNQWTIFGLFLIAISLISILVWFVIRRMKSRGIVLAPWRM